MKSFKISDLLFRYIRIFRQFLRDRDRRRRYRQSQTAVRKFSRPCRRKHIAHLSILRRQDRPHRARYFLCFVVFRFFYRPCLIRRLARFRLSRRQAAYRCRSRSPKRTALLCKLSRFGPSNRTSRFFESGYGRNTFVTVGGIGPEKDFACRIDEDDRSRFIFTFSNHV